ncbi:MAG: hypothetical protein ACR2PV_07760, partial [Gammaproteobacteria bacterium]
MYSILGFTDGDLFINVCRHLRAAIADNLPSFAIVATVSYGDSGKIHKMNRHFDVIVIGGGHAGSE